MGRRVAGSIVVLILALAGCDAGERDAAGVESHVKTYERDDVEVKSCNEIGDAITDDEDYGATLHEAWSCDVKQLDATSAYAEACYVVYNELESGVVRGIRCTSVGQGCPAGGRHDREAQTVYLGQVIHPTLVLDRARGNDPSRTTVRVEVFHQEPEGAKEHCGYLNVRVPVGDDPMAMAAERVEGNGWAESPYSFSYSSIDD
jgi:hypothetical protein